MKLALCLMIVLSSCATGVLSQKYFGVNKAALGWGPGALPGVLHKNYHLLNNSRLDYFSQTGMNTIRVSIIWERLQPVINNGNGDFNMTYVGYLNQAVHYITNVKRMYCIVDIHNYFRYRGQVIGVSPNVPLSALQNMWKKLAALYYNNQRIIWGSMNEPYDVPASLALRGPMLLSPYSGVYNWMNGENHKFFGPSNITDPANNWMYEMHQYFDKQGGTTVCYPDYSVEYLFEATTQWARANGKTIFLGEFGINDSDLCLPLLNRFMAYLTNNTDVWQGWTWWAAGPAWEDDKMPYVIEPKPDLTDRNRLMGTLKKYFPKGAVSASPSRSPTPSRSPKASASPSRKP